ncbi:hypothetical protein ACLB2K_016367 [Fragaria x ananassa]
MIGCALEGKLLERVWEAISLYLIYRVGKGNMESHPPQSLANEEDFESGDMGNYKGNQNVHQPLQIRLLVLPHKLLFLTATSWI